jgi:hypothetical protein
LAKHFSGLKLLRSQASHDADGNSSIESGGGALAADVTKRDA